MLPLPVEYLIGVIMLSLFAFLWVILWFGCPDCDSGIGAALYNVAWLGGIFGAIFFVIGKGRRLKKIYNF
jgi:hypothetical protein